MTVRNIEQKEKGKCGEVVINDFENEQWHNGTVIFLYTFVDTDKNILYTTFRFVSKYFTW